MDARVAGHASLANHAPAAPVTWRERAEPWFWLAPSLILLLGIGLYPLLYTLVSSFQYWVLTGGPPEWTGLDNYVEAVTSSDFSGTVGRTLLLLALTLLVEIALGLLTALALDSSRAPLLRRLLQVCLVIPIAVTPSVVGLLTQLMFNKQFGIVNHALGWVGIDAVDWLGDPTMAFVTVMVVQV